MIILNIFLSLISFFMYSPVNDDEVEVVYNEINEIKCDYYIIKNDRVSFYYNDNYLFSITGDDLNYTCFEYNNILYIAYNDSNKLKLLAYNESAKKTLDKTYSILDDIYIESKLKMEINEDKIYLFASNYQEDNYDLVFITIDLKGNILDYEHFGGEKNEYFIDYIKIDSKYYVLLKHDMLSLYSDFGNHGNYVLAIIDNNKVLKYVSFKEDKLSSFTYSHINDTYSINVSFNNSLYSFDTDLNQNIGLEFPLESTFISLSFSKLVLVIDTDKVNIYDYTNNTLLKSVELSNIDNMMVFKEAKLIEGYIYLYFTDGINENVYLFDIFDLRGRIKEINYLNGLSEYNEYFYTFNEKLNTIKDLSNFSSSINGDYNIKITYNSKYNSIERNMLVHVLEEQNVLEGMIYPINYHLMFTGTAFLNGKMINNNYAINEKGEYKLELYDINKNKRVINFLVSPDQIEFEPLTNHKSDFEIISGESIDINYHLVLNEGESIENIIVDGKEYNKYKYNNNLLTITFSDKTLGQNIHNIESININTDIGLVSIDIKDKISINVYDNSPNIESYVYVNKKDIVLDYYNDSTNIRMINIYLDNIFYKSYPLSEAEILINTKMEYNEIRFMLCYDIGDDKYLEKEIMHIIKSDKEYYNIGHIIMNKREENLINFQISINKDSFSSLYIENDLIYELANNESNRILIIIISSISIIISSLIIIIKRKKKHTYLLIK